MKKSKYPIFQQLKQSRTMGIGAFWSECAIQAIACFCSVIVMLIVVSVIVGDNMQRINQIAGYASVALALLWCIPVARNTRYRLRDAGFGPKAYLWLLLPGIGWLIFIGLLCVKGKQRTPEEDDNSIYSWDC